MPNRNIYASEQLQKLSAAHKVLCNTRGVEPLSLNGRELAARLLTRAAEVNQIVPQYALRHCPFFTALKRRVIRVLIKSKALVEGSFPFREEKPEVTAPR